MKVERSYSSRRFFLYESPVAKSETLGTLQAWTPIRKYEDRWGSILRIRRVAFGIEP